jgi:hypothetical protein
MIIKTARKYAMADGGAPANTNSAGNLTKSISVENQGELSVVVCLLFLCL